MSYIELQVDLETFTALLPTQVSTLVGTRFFADGSDFVVEAMAVGRAWPSRPPDSFFYSYADGDGGVATDSISAPDVQFSMLINVSVASAGRHPRGRPLQTEPYFLMYNLNVDGGVTPEGAGLLTLAPSVAAGADAVSQALAQGLLLGNPGLTVSLPFGNYNFVNGSVSISSDESCLAVRLQPGLATAPYTKALWTEFFTGSGIEDHLKAFGSAPASAFLTSDLIVQMVELTFDAGLSQSSTFVLSSVVANWAPTATASPHIDVTAVGSASPPVGPSLGVTITAGVDIGLQVPLPSDTLVTSTQFSFTTNPWDELLDLLLAAVAGFVGGEAALDVTGVPGGLAALPGLVAGFVAALVAFSTYTPDVTSSNCTQSGNSVVCTTTLAVPTNPSTNTPLVQFTGAAGAPDGLVLLSTLPPI